MQLRLRRSRTDGPRASLSEPLWSWVSGIPWRVAVGIVRTVDEEKRKNVVVTDHRSRVVRSIDGENIAKSEASSSFASSNYYYGPFGHLAWAQDNRGLATGFLTDAYGRLLVHLDPDSGTTNNTYNGFDELKTVTDPALHLRSYFHDAFGRLDHIEDDQGVTRWKYDQGANGLGRISETISPTGQHVHFAYEPPSPSANRGLLNGITYAIDGIDYSIAVEHDSLGRTSRVHYPTRGNETPIVAEYTYDRFSGALAALREVGNGSKLLWQIDEVTPENMLQRESFGNGATTRYGYHQTRRWLERIETTLASNSIQALVYKHYTNGLVQEKTAVGGSAHAYTYDALNRLANDAETVAGASVSSSAYTYDDIGNIKSRGAKVTSYDAARPHLVESINGNAYTYDTNGNVTSRIGPDIPGGRQLLQYAPFDLPTAISSGSQFAPAQTTRFEYTADEERVVRRDESAGVTHHFVSDLYERSLDYVDTTIEQRFRLFVGARAIGEIVRKDGGDQTLYFHSDHLGSVDTLSDDADSSFEQHFDPFGAKRDAPNPALTRAGFTGHNSEDDLGLIDMKGRFYDPLAARFMSPDPVMQAPFSTQGLNRYSYVFNNPMNATDPSGFEVTTGQWIGGTAFTAGVVGLLAQQAGLFSGIGSAATAMVASPLAAAPGGVGNLVSTLGPGAPSLDGSMAAGPVQNVATPSTAVRTAGVSAASPHPTGQNNFVLGPKLTAPDLTVPERFSHSGRFLADNEGMCTEESECDPYRTHLSEHGRVNVLPMQLLAEAIRGAIDLPGHVWRWLRPQPPPPAPGVPFKGFQEWGRPLWGKNVQEARKALNEMTPEVAKTIDPGKARQALEFYKQAGASGRGGATAGVRVHLMRRILQLQR